MVHRCGPGSIPRPGITCGLSLLSVLIEGFLCVLRFSSLHKNQHAKFQLSLDACMPSKQVLELFGITWINKLPFIFTVRFGIHCTFVSFCRCLG